MQFNLKTDHEAKTIIMTNDEGDVVATFNFIVDGYATLMGNAIDALGRHGHSVYDEDTKHFLVGDLSQLDPIR